MTGREREHRIRTAANTIAAAFLHTATRPTDPPSVLYRAAAEQLDDAGLLQSPETAAELDHLRERVAAQSDCIAAMNDAQQIIAGERNRAEAERDAALARVAELEAQLAAEPRATDAAVDALAAAVPPPCGHDAEDRCEDCHLCPCAVCPTCRVCACTCQCEAETDGQGEPDTAEWVKCANPRGCPRREKAAKAAVMGWENGLCPQCAAHAADRADFLARGGGDR